MGPHTALQATSLALVTCGAWVASASLGSARDHVAQESAAPKSAEGLAAWQQVYSVVTSPRCVNCHTATNYPLQGDDRHRHFANVIRGPEGKGVPGENCVSCHQSVNAESTGVPGG